MLVEDLGLESEIPRTLLFVAQQAAWALACLCHFPLTSKTHSSNIEGQDRCLPKGWVVLQERNSEFGNSVFIASSNNLFVLEGDITLSYRLLIVKRTLREAQIEYQGFVFLSFSAKQAGPWKTHRVVPFPTFHLFALPPWHLTDYHMGMTLLYHAD